jgi:hypothetical protein
LSIPRRTFRSPSEPVTSVDLPDVAGTGGENPPEHAGEVETVTTETPQDGPTEPAGESAETVAADVTPVPESALQRAEAMAVETAARMEDLVAQRREVLLTGSDDQIAEVDAKVAVAERLLKTRSDRVSALREQAEREAAEQRAADREARIVETERLFIERDAAAADLRDSIVSAEAAFRRVHQLNLEARAAWKWPHGRVGATLTASSDLTQAVSAFIFKVGGRPPQTGGEYQPHVPPAFPGARCPRVEWQQAPDRCPDLAAQYREASRYASDIMRGNVPVPEPVPASPDTTETFVSVEGRIAGQSTGPNGPVANNVPTLTPEMVEIIRRQMQLAMKDDPASAEEYRRNGELLASMSEMSA